MSNLLLINFLTTLSNSDQTCFGLPAKVTATEIKTNVRNNSDSFDRDVVAGTTDVVHNGRVHSHPSRVGCSVGLVSFTMGPPDRLKRHEWLRIQARRDSTDRGGS